MGSRSVMISTVLVLGLVACGGNATTGAPEQPSSDEPSDSTLVSDCLDPAVLAFSQADVVGTGFDPSDRLLMNRIFDCLEPFETVIHIRGLPEVSGWYTSRDPGMVFFYGYGGPDDQGRFEDGIDQCFVSERAFRTNVNVTDLDPMERGIEDFPAEGFASIDIDLVGGPGEPIVGINLYSHGEGLAESVSLLANYFSGLSGGEVVMSVTHLPTDTNHWAGFATFSSEFYDVTKYQNFLTEEGPNLPSWRNSGSPTVPGEIALWCGG